MSGIATAIVGSAIVGGVVASKSAGAQADAASDAAATDAAIAEQNIEFQREMAEQQREDFAPWRDTGEQALNQIWEGVQSGAFQVGDIDVTKDPGYQFRMDQGVQALDSSAAARGRLLSGAQQKAVTDYSQNVASQEYANAYARESDEIARNYNILSNLSVGGQSSAAGQAQTSGQLASNVGNIYSNTAATQAGLIQAEGAARAGAYEGVGTSVNQAAQNWLTYKAMA